MPIAAVAIAAVADIGVAGSIGAVLAGTASYVRCEEHIARAVDGFKTEALSSQN